MRVGFTVWRVKDRARRSPIAQIVASLIVVVVGTACGDPRSAGVSVDQTASTLSTSVVSDPSAPEVTPTSTTIDPLAPTTLPFDPALPPCVEAHVNLLLTPTGDIAVAHVTLKIQDTGVTGHTDGGYPVLNAALAAGDLCQLGYGSSQRVTVAGRPPQWTLVSVDGELPDVSAGSDISHLTGRNLTTGEFYNCANSDPTMNLGEALAAIVATSSLTCRSSLSIRAA